MSVFSPIIIGISGGSGSGKTTLAQHLQLSLNPDKTTLIGQDHYYFDLSNQIPERDGTINFDSPTALDFELLHEHIQNLSQNNAIRSPVYNFHTNQRTADTVEILPKRVIIIDGILIFANQKIRELFDLKIFVDATEEQRFSRRISRDIIQRGRTQECVMKQLSRYVKPMHDLYVEPYKDVADLILSGTNSVEENTQAARAMIDEISLNKIAPQLSLFSDFRNSQPNFHS